MVNPGSFGSSNPPKPQRAARKLGSVVTAISGAIVAVLTVLALVLPAPYVTESPGPTINTLSSVNGKKLVSIEGRQTYPSDSELDLVTVYVDGGPVSRVTTFDVLASFLNPGRAIYPQYLIYPEGATQDEVNKSNAADMTNSQDLARAAALSFLKIPFSTELSVVALSDNSASAGKIQPNDVIKAFNGTQVNGQVQLRDAVAANKDAEATVTVLRDGKQVDVRVKPAKSDSGVYLLGVQLAQKFTFPFSINFNLSNVGGPSAGMMFSLAIIDQLTPGSLAGGKHVAGTGTIDADGTVGPIGGIAQKMIGARNAGATLFLAPADNCNEVTGHIPSGLTVVRVSTLSDAYTAVDKYGKGEDISQLPRCGS